MLIAPTREPRPAETAPFSSDPPATQDLLNRRAGAETLGTIVDEVWYERQAAEKNEKREPDAGRAARDRSWESLRDGGHDRTADERGGEGVRAGVGGATLELGTHPLAEEFRSLGLPKRALFTTYMSKMTLRFHGAEKTRP